MISLLLQLAKGIWFIEPAYAEAYKPVVSAIMRGQKVDFSALMPNNWKNDDDDDSTELKKERFQYLVNASSPFSFSRYTKLDDAPRGSVAVTPVKGAVMKNDYCGSPGTQTLRQWMQQADEHPNISAHILYIDSPGGSADGTMDFSEAIKSLNKPVVAFSDGLMASAAYWIGSSARHIMASNTLNEIGSIGTYMTLTDWRGYDEKMGIKEIPVYATKSTEKNIEFRQAIDGNVEPLRKNLIDPFNEAFLASVTRNRRGKGLNKEMTLKGQLHLTAQALEYGLIDSVGTFNDAIVLAQKLSRT
jgi:ClpP class serine protease